MKQFIDIFQELVNQGGASSPMMKLLGMRLVEVSTGRVLFLGKSTEHHANFSGTLHGGYYASCLDCAMGTAVNTHLNENEKYATLEMSIKMLKFLPFDKEVFVEGKVLKIGGKIAVAEAKMFDENQVIYAVGQSTCIINR